MRTVNPLYHPFAVLAGGIILFIAVRLLQLPSAIALPSAIGGATLLAFPLSRQEANRIKLDNPVLVREITAVKQQAKLLAQKALTLRSEARQMLTNSSQLELLAAVEYACEHTLELPEQIDTISGKFQGEDSLLSVAELKKQIALVESRKGSSSEAVERQLEQLKASLENNLRLAIQGRDTREARVISLNMLVTESAGILQQLQNSLRTSNLNDSAEIQELKALSEDLKSIQESVTLLFELAQK